MEDELQDRVFKAHEIAQILVINSTLAYLT